MKPSTLRSRLLALGFEDLGLVNLWWRRMKKGVLEVDIPELDYTSGAERLVDQAVREIGAAIGSRLDWPEWLDEPWDRCPTCGGEASLVVDIDVEVRCSHGCPTMWWAGPDAPTGAQMLAESAVGRMVLAELGHPLGISPGGGTLDERK